MKRQTQIPDSTLLQTPQLTLQLTKLQPGHFVLAFAPAEGGLYITLHLTPNQLAQLADRILNAVEEP